MKKLYTILLVLFLNGCEMPEVTTEIDCEVFPDATVCQEEIVEETEPVEEVISYYPYNYSNGSEFFDAYFNMTLYLKSDQHQHDYYSMYFRLGERLHYLTDKHNPDREYRFDYSHLVSIRDINNNPEQKHYVSEEFFDLLEFAVENNQLVEGYFDITIDPVSHLWHELREKCTDYNFNDYFCSLPEEEALNLAETKMGIDRIHLNREDLSIQMEEGMSIDLGAVAKGYFVERLAEKFIEEDVDGFIISAGGNVKTHGGKPDGSNFTIGVQDPFVPRGQGVLEEVISLPGGYSIVSSGDQEKFYMVDGEIYHHIISPFSLYPDRYSRQVTIVTNDSGLGDVLSTSIYIMPLDEAYQFVESLDYVEAIWVLFDGEVMLSSGMDKFIIYDVES